MFVEKVYDPPSYLQIEILTIFDKAIVEAISRRVKHDVLVLPRYTIGLEENQCARNI
jgi:hypothetical protein